MNHPLLHLVNSCQTLKSLKSIHARLQIDGSITSSNLVLNKILRLYSRFEALTYAQNLFDKIPEPNSFLWTSLIHGYVENKYFKEAITLFRRMRNDSIPPLNFTVTSVLKALARQGRLKDGEAVYGFVLKYGFGFDVMVQNAMLDLFMRSEKVDLAEYMFDEMPERDIVSWNTMISGHGNNGRVDIARELFDSMSDRNLISWTSIICGYVKAADMVKARDLFEAIPKRDLAVWNVMVSGYVDAGNLEDACLLFEQMPIRDISTWNLILSGLCKAGELEKAKNYFNMMPNRNVASWTIMIDGHIKSDNLYNAKLMFDQMPEKNLVSWSTMIGGYAKNGQPLLALQLFECFKEQGIKPDETFILGVISACSQLGILNRAETVVHDWLGPSFYSNIQLVTTLIDMYAKCGSIDKALQVFKMSSNKDLHCYSTMIAAFANHGLGREAISLFNDMLKENIKPDGVTYLGILSACNHAGLVDEGRMYFKQMSLRFGVKPNEKHYACVIDLLGRAGHLQEAYELIISMPMAPTSVVWGALLAACNVHCNVELAEVAAAELFVIEPENSGNYVLLSNTYAAAGRWHDVAKVRGIIKDVRVKKNRGSSWVELGAAVYEFVMGDLSHLESESIYFILDLLHEDMKFLGSIQDDEILMIDAVV